MSLPLPADLQSRIEAQLATGEFASDVEVLREAIDASYDVIGKMLS